MRREHLISITGLASYLRDSTELPEVRILRRAPRYRGQVIRTCSRLNGWTKRNRLLDLDRTQKDRSDIAVPAACPSDRHQTRALHDQLWRADLLALAVATALQSCSMYEYEGRFIRLISFRTRTPTRTR
jgi:hypothetical protein